MMTDPDHIRTLMPNCPRGLAKGEWTPVPAEVYPLTGLAPRSAACSRLGTSARSSQMPKTLQPRADRTYLITGGLGALGLHTAAYLAQLGAGTSW